MSVLDDGVPFGLPGLAEVAAAEAERRRLRAKRLCEAVPWPADRPDPELERVRALWPHPYRLVVAQRLARDVDTCAELLAGAPLDPARLNPEGLQWARTRTLVRLDLRAIDLLEGVE